MSKQKTSYTGFRNDTIGCQITDKNRIAFFTYLHTKGLKGAINSNDFKQTKIVYAYLKPSLSRVLFAEIGDYFVQFGHGDLLPLERFLEVVVGYGNIHGLSAGTYSNLPYA